MPYIEPHRRAAIDSGSISSSRPPTDSVIGGDGLLEAGELTYVLQQTIRNYLIDHGMRYATMASILGALEGCKADFIQRVVTPYEEGKRCETGDVWGRLGECA